MDWITLLVGVALGILWLVGLSISSVMTWFAWLVFLAALILIVSAFAGVGFTKKHSRNTW